MEIIEKKINELIPYDKNPRKNDKAVEYVANSIKEFGFKVPIVIDKNNVVVTGHTRLKACKKLGIKKVPCVIADDLTDEQIKAFRIADNKVGEVAEWDYKLLDAELDTIDFNFEDFGFEMPDVGFKEEHQEEYQEQKHDMFNLLSGDYTGSGKFGIPEILPLYELPKVEEWIGFNYVKTTENMQGKGVHFFLDDYQFERVWNMPEVSAQRLLGASLICSPDFSMFTDFAPALQIYNHYRKHWVARYWQTLGYKVIPTICWSDKKSFDWCFEGEPHNSVVIVSTVGTQNDKIASKLFMDGYEAMQKAISPSKVLVYGNIPKELEQDNIETIEQFSAKWNKTT